MKLNCLHYLCLLLSLCFGLTSAAQTERVEVDHVFYNIDPAAGTAEVSYYLSYNPANGDYYKGDVVIPETFDYEGTTYTVTSVAQRAFYYCTDMTSIQLPATVHTIYSNVFFGCTNLKRANIPEGVTNLSTSLFTNCTSLEEVELPSTLTTIGSAVFSKCASLRHINLPDGITDIGICAFMDAGLEEIVLPARLRTIANKAFMYCINLKTLSFPDQLYSIGEQCFEGSKNLERVDLGVGLSEIDIRCFAECPKLKEVLCRNPRRVINSYTGIFYNSPIERILVPNDFVARYAADQAWNVAPNIVPLQCATPRVACTPQGLKISTSTNLDYCNQKEFYTYSIDVTDVKQGTTTSESLDAIGELLLTYDVKAISHAEGVLDSDEACFTLCWLDQNVKFYPEGEYEGEQTAVEPLQAAQRPVVVQSDGGQLVISGLDNGEGVQFYSVDGRLLGATTASAGSASFSLAPGQVVIVRVGRQSFKVRVR